MHIIEETQLFPKFEPVQTLLLSSKKVGATSITTLIFFFFLCSIKLIYDLVKIILMKQCRPWKSAAVVSAVVSVFSLIISVAFDRCQAFEVV